MSTFDNTTLDGIANTIGERGEVDYSVIRPWLATAGVEMLDGFNLDIIEWYFDALAKGDPEAIATDYPGYDEHIGRAIDRIVRAFAESLRFVRWDQLAACTTMQLRELVVNAEGPSAVVDAARELLASRGQLSDYELEDDAQDRLTARNIVGEACIKAGGWHGRTDVDGWLEDRNLAAQRSIANVLTALFGPSGTRSPAGTVETDHRVEAEAEVFLTASLRLWREAAKEYGRKAEPADALESPPAPTITVPATYQVADALERASEQGDPDGVLFRTAENIRKMLRRRDSGEAIACHVDESAGVREETHGGITPAGLALGHRYVMGNVNAYCPKCSEERSAEEGRPITVLDCEYDVDK